MPDHPAVARRRSLTGEHPAYAKSSGDIVTQQAEALAGTYQPTDDELERMGTDRVDWATMGNDERRRRIDYIDAAAPTGTPPRDASDAANDARRATLTDDDAAFQAAIANVQEPERSRLVRGHLRAKGASEDAINAGLFALASQGLRGLTDWFNRDLQTELARIRAAGLTEQTRIREEQATARAEIEAATRRYEADHPRYTPPAPAQPAQSNALLYVGVGVGLIGVIAALVMSSRKGG